MTPIIFIKLYYGRTPDMPEPQIIESLAGFVDEAEKAITSAKELGYIGVSVGLSLETALNLVEAAKRFQEPTFLGFPKRLVEAFIENEAEAELPAEVVKSYRDYMTAEHVGWETKEEFFFDEAFDVQKQTNR
ncbi:hypothetical protein [Shewanella morhuae]|uniref:Uncharacterized protein n=1 Tax=Shewanella morhuae TaxID=365591 RepID=A0A380BYC9_9GAMM|nr:hypothetical protein [Shewanella morhuae]SUJ08382.1 Uncharacterised protein [Shewanella morhuae]